MNNPRLETLVNQIEQKTLLASDDLKNVTASTRHTREGMKRRAQEDLVDLKNEYRNALLQSATVVVVTGPQAGELLTLAGGHSLTSSSDNFTEELLKQVDSRAYLNRCVDGTYFMALTNALESVGEQIGVRSFPQLNFKSNYSKIVETLEQAKALTEEVVINEVGGELLGVYAVSKNVDNALLNRHVDKFTPVLLRVDNETSALKVLKDMVNLTRNTFLVHVGGKTPKNLKGIHNSLSVKEASQESLNETLEAVKSKSV